ncbi:MAG: phosphate starvation-inducible protein PhoH [Kordiimonadales bacterium]|nr:MAG: phosphate starvation-inducible protein PhoH [Kordiimonadales bacterium]
MHAKNKSTNTEEHGFDSRKGESHRVVVEFQDNKLAAMVFGQHDQNLARIEQRLHVSLINRGNRIAIEGAAGPSAQAKSILAELYEMAEKGRELSVGDVDGVVRMLVDLKTADDGATGTRAAGNLKIVTRTKVVLPRSSGQADYIEKLQKNEMVFGVGPAGTGKTYLAVAMAVSCMISGEVDRIILSRPAVEAGEKLGFLPGDLKEKVDPYLRPLYDALYDMMPAEQVEKFMITGQIEVAPLAYMRGRTLSNAFVILDEAQNTTSMQMKMFLTRFGENSRMVICGDPSQVDLPRGIRSGLRHALDVLRSVESIATTRFNQTDVVRHPLVARIVEAYGEEDGR